MKVMFDLVVDLVEGDLVVDLVEGNTNSNKDGILTVSMLFISNVII